LGHCWVGTQRHRTGHDPRAWVIVLVMGGDDLVRCDTSEDPEEQDTVGSKIIRPRAATMAMMHPRDHEEAHGLLRALKPAQRAHDVSIILHRLQRRDGPVAPAMIDQ